MLEVAADANALRTCGRLPGSTSGLNIDHDSELQYLSSPVSGPAYPSTGVRAIHLASVITLHEIKTFSATPFHLKHRSSLGSLDLPTATLSPYLAIGMCYCLP